MKITASQNYAMLLQIRAAIYLILSSFVTGVLAALNIKLSIAFAAVSILLYSVAAIFYIRRFVLSLSVIIEYDRLVIKRGVFFVREELLPLNSVKYIEVSRTPFSRLLDVYTVIAHTSSGAIRIHGSDRNGADLLVNSVEGNRVADRGERQNVSQ